MNQEADDNKKNLAGTHEEFDEELDEDIIALIPGYLNNRRKDIDKMQQAFEKQDIKPIKEIAHNIKGTALSYGQKSLNEIAIRLDHAAAISDWDKVSTELQLMKKLLDN